MDYTKDMEMGCELLHEQFSDLVRKIKANGMSSGDLDKLDKVAHALKSIKGTMQMEQADEEGYSGMYPYMGGYGYNRGGSYERGNGGSYARGRTNARRDSMGRYSGERGYSRNDLSDKMRELMEDAPDERTRREIQQMIDRLDS
ncbi:MAG: hypothetical protein IKP72_14930 [Clostridia bacterium]|nr:hypothetical protein [Clostridia bacterium]